MPCRENWIVIDSLLIFLQGKRYRLSGRTFDFDGPAASANAPGSMLRARFRSREVGCREPTAPSHRYRRALLRWQREHVPRCGAWRVTEPLAKFACEMSIVAKATDVGDLA
jgi:hypothetical protein